MATVLRAGSLARGARTGVGPIDAESVRSKSVQESVVSPVTPGVEADPARREASAMRRMTDSLVEDLSGSVPADQVTSAVGEAHTRFAASPIREFVPILVERIVRRELAEPIDTVRIPASATHAETALARAAGTEPPGALDTPPEGIALPRFDRRKLAPLALGAAAVVAVSAGAVAVFSADGDDAPAPVAAPLSVIRGVVGSEKIPFFTDPKVVAVLADNGIRVEVESAGSRQIATSVDLGALDFAFPSSSPAAERIQRQRNITGRYTPFSSPMAIATYRPIADLLTAAGVITAGPVPGFDMNRFLEIAGNGVQWDQLPGNTVYPVRKNILVSTTDPRTSNSAAMYLAIASYVANDNTVVRGGTAEQFVLPTLSKLFLAQGYTDSSSEGPFGQYLDNGMGATPLVCIYEAQFLEAAGAGRIKPDMVLTYPSPTVLSRHTLVPLTAGGDRIGKLLTENPELRRLAVEHGFRTGEDTQFAQVAAERRVAVPTPLIDLVDPPAYDTLEHLLDGVAKSYN
ncbi:three-helix bundle dimerization domain-containing protein [Nocardia thailandica]|uniref:three-helix bundle dimerization domain-containing protein n=1 Tax=Nocardia thailandica TaxID=257275 RepID=UPI00402BDE3F